MTCETGSKNLFYGYDGELCGVELLALQYYDGEGGGWQGVHSESGIWMTIFGILMWDVIFSNVPDVFRSRFQVQRPIVLRGPFVDENFFRFYPGIIASFLIFAAGSTRPLYR